MSELALMESTCDWVVPKHGCNPNFYGNQRFTFQVCCSMFPHYCRGIVDDIDTIRRDTHSPLPTKKQRNLLNGFYRLRSLQLIKEEASNSLARKILDRSMSENALTRTLAERDKSIINTRDSYNKLYRALLNPLNPKQVQHRRFVQWNYARHGLRRKPAPFTPEKWPLATIIGQNNPTLRLMAMRWHLGRFSLNIDQDPLSDDRQHFLILHSMFKTPHKEISTRHIQAVEDSITHFLNQHNQ